MATTEELSGLSGGVSGFADALLAGIQAKREQEAAANKFQAYVELQRELMGAKNVSGKELMELALSLDIKPDVVKANIDPTSNYPIASINALLNNLRAKEVAAGKEVGATKRAEIKAGAKKAGGGTTKTFDPTQAQMNILQGIPGMLGYKKGTPMKSLFKSKEEAERMANTAMDLARARLKGAMRESDFDVQSPFEMTQEPGWFDTATYEPRSMFLVRKAEAAPGGYWETPAGAPAPGAVPPAPLVAPTLAPTKEAVGTDREALRKRFRKL